jgi:hypothetical protein
MKRWFFCFLILIVLPACRTPQVMMTEPEVATLPSVETADVPYGWRETWTHEVRPVLPTEEPHNEFWLSVLIRQIIFCL